jgi:hypothetical protein
MNILKTLWLNLVKVKKNKVLMILDNKSSKVDNKGWDIKEL